MMRDCDYCVRTAARWFCAADDAFLCEGCDFSVHTANGFSRRHHRVRLKTAAAYFKNLPEIWNSGITRKARTPRRKKRVGVLPRCHLVPESVKSIDETDEQVLYRVPIFDPELGDWENINEVYLKNETTTFFEGFFSFENDVPDFEAVLGKGITEDGNFAKEELGFFEANSSNVFLNLNYEGVLSSWDSKRSPWINGEPPDSNSVDISFSDFTGFSGKTGAYGSTGIVAETPAAEGEREARVSRYRDKRQTRLFSKRIRYEVRKVNAQNRPRLKGRFVKTQHSFSSKMKMSIFV